MYATVIAKGVTDFANNCELLKYGLHLDAVTSRWAREYANEVGALDVTKNNCEPLKYGLHLDAVISRWAREHANEVGALDVTKKSDICKKNHIFL